MFQPVDFWAAVVFPCAIGHLELPPNSPAQIVLTRLQQLGMTVSVDGTVRDLWGSFCPSTVSFAELVLRLQSAWVRVVAAEVSHRSGLENADVLMTRRSLSELSVADRSLYRLCLSGGFVTEEVKAKWSAKSDKCKWCDQTDSLHHRIWQCPRYAHLRATLAPDAVRCLPSLPNALALRGWAMQSPTWNEWMQTLSDIPHDVPLLR